MNDKNTEFRKMFMRRIWRGFFMMFAVIGLSVLAALVFYLTTPENEPEDSLSEFAENSAAVNRDTPASNGR